MLRNVGVDHRAGHGGGKKAGEDVLSGDCIGASASRVVDDGTNQGTGEDAGECFMLSVIVFAPALAEPLVLILVMDLLSIGHDSSLSYQWY